MKATARYNEGVEIIKNIISPNMDAENTTAPVETPEVATESEVVAEAETEVETADVSDEGEQEEGADEE